MESLEPIEKRAKVSNPPLNLNNKEHNEKRELLGAKEPKTTKTTI